MYFRSFPMPGKEHLVKKQVVVESECTDCAFEVVKQLTVGEVEYPGELVNYAVIDAAEVGPDEEVHPAPCRQRRQCRDAEFE